MANFVNIATIGPKPITLSTDMKHQKMIDKMLEHWKNKIDKVLPDKPDLIVLPEACDRPAELSRTQQKQYSLARGDKFQQFFASVAKKNNCYIVYSAHIQSEDGTWRNASMLFDRAGKLAGQYHKNHLVIEERTEADILYGKEPRIIQCDFGRVGFAICFDLNFNELRLKYAKLKPDLLAFSSMYHGGLMQSYWAYSCRCHFVGAIGYGQSQIRNPQGNIIASSTNYFDFVTKTVNLDCCLAHLDYNWDKLEALKKKYGPNVSITEPGYLGSVLVASKEKDITAKNMIEEFDIELLDDYFNRALAHRDLPGNIEP
jgi:predicted amidohydrolase